MSAINTSLDINEFGKLTREQLVYLARTAEASERYEDMCKFMSKLVNLVVPGNGDLTIEERNLLSVAYKNVVGSRRASWRALQLEDALAVQYRVRVENELESLCKEVLALLESRLLQVSRAGAEEAAVFYLKMTADYYRYMSEFKPKAQGVAASTANSEGMAAKYYGEAMALAQSKLPATHPIRLGLALNYSVCHYEILRDPKVACNVAKTAFDEAIKDLDQLDEASYKDSTLIMQLLRDNLTLWTNESQQDLHVEDVQNS
jgi:14-3-3 protein epsilon